MTRHGIKTYITSGSPDTGNVSPTKASTSRKNDCNVRINDNVTLTSPKCSVVLYLHLVQGLRCQKFSTEIFEIFSHMCYRNINTNAWKFSLWSLFFYLGRATSPQTFGTYLVYSPRKRQTIHWGQKFYDNRKAFSLCPYVQVSKWSLRNLILYTFLMILYMYIAPGQGQKTLGDKLLISTESPYHFYHLLQVSNKSLWILILYTFFNVFPHVFSPGAGADNPLWTKFWCQQKGLVTLPICCKFQKNIFEVWFYTYFCLFLYMYIAPGQGKTTPSGQHFYFNINL